MNYIINQGYTSKQFRQEAIPAYSASSTKPIMKLYSTTMEGLLRLIDKYPDINFKIENNDQSKF